MLLMHTDKDRHIAKWVPDQCHCGGKEWESIMSKEDTTLKEAWPYVVRCELCESEHSCIPF